MWKDLEGFMSQVLYFIIDLNWSISEKTWETIEQNTFTHFLELFTHAKKVVMLPALELQQLWLVTDSSTDDATNH